MLHPCWCCLLIDPLRRDQRLRIGDSLNWSVRNFCLSYTWVNVYLHKQVAFKSRHYSFIDVVSPRLFKYRVERNKTKGQNSIFDLARRHTQHQWRSNASTWKLLFVQINVHPCIAPPVMKYNVSIYFQWCGICVLPAAAAGQPKRAAAAQHHRANN